eukprot:m51a1_g996 hypothetical protein (246) ;mRNA; r:532200-547703
MSSSDGDGSVPVCPPGAPALMASLARPPALRPTSPASIRDQSAPRVAAPGPGAAPLLRPSGRAELLAEIARPAGAGEGQQLRRAAVPTADGSAPRVEGATLRTVDRTAQMQTLRHAAVRRVIETEKLTVRLAHSMSKESITKAGVKQAQAGKKQKKMKESMLDNKKIKVTLKLNVAAIESKEVAGSKEFDGLDLLPPQEQREGRRTGKIFESQNNCKKIVLIASKLMTWKPEDVQKLTQSLPCPR